MGLFGVGRRVGLVKRRPGKGLFRSGARKRSRPGRHRIAPGLAVLALSAPLALPGAGTLPARLPLPSEASVRSTVTHLVDWLTDQHSPVPAVPRQQTGSAAGKAHSVPAAVTRAVARATGHQPGNGRGQRPAYAAHGPTARKFTTKSAGGGFDPKTSRLLASATSATSDLYKNADGSYTRRVFQGPVNYQTSSGGWAPIDETLVKGSGGRWQEKANSVGASFATAGDAQVLGTLTTADGSESVSFSLAGAAAVTGVTAGSSVTYPGILPGTDVTETATATGISESLTLHSAGVATSWVFPLKLTGLTATLSGDSVDLTGSSGNVVWVIPPAAARSGPVNLATADSQASAQLAYQLVTYNGGPALEMTLDQSWLAAPDRVFPVTIDPTFSPNPVGSTYVESKNGTAETAAHGGSEFLPSGTVTDNGTFDDIDFLDFSGMVGDKLPDQHITAASLHLFDVWAYQCSYSEEVYAYQVTGSWKPSSTLTYPGPSYGTKDAQWTGTASSAACSNTSGKPGQGAWISLGFNSSGLSLLNGWDLADGVPNYGFAVAPSLTDEQMWKQFDSANDGNVPSSDGGDCTGNCEPYLQMTYTADVAPQINSQGPPDNYNSATLTPELKATGKDPDTWPDSSLKYVFTVYTSAGTKVASSGLISSGYWTVPAGDLSWNQTYYWTVQDFDGLDYSPTVTTSYFSTPVPQPLVTSGLSQNESGPGFDAGSGDYTTSATDAQVSTVGPALEITRDYNSQDPRSSGAFGAGWSSVLDMKVSPGQVSSSGSTATEVVTYPDGEEVAFGLTASGTYAAPPGRYATLAAAPGGGFTLTDKNDTVYTFTQSLGSGVYGISSITDVFGHTETFTWTSASPYEITQITSASGRALGINWAAAGGGAAYPHVSQIYTNPVTPGDASTDLTWEYNYTGDDLTSVCAPLDWSHCTAYTYDPGSDYPEAVLDSGPQSYWPLDDPAGSSSAASSVLANESADDGTYSGVSLGGAAGPLAASSATAASFNGSSSFVSLPGTLPLMDRVDGQPGSFAVWFKTTGTNEVIYSSQSHSLPSASTGCCMTPSLYVGKDGKLNAEFWNGSVDVITSGSAVNDGNWHFAVLSAQAGSQTLYLDGKSQGSKSGALTPMGGQTYVALGGGYLTSEWPDNTESSSPAVAWFSGDLADAAFWSRPLTATEVDALYAAGTHAAAWATQVTRPSGSVYAKINYDPPTGRATSVTDENGGSWTISQPTVSGSSQVYVGSVLGARPQDYWRLSDSGTTDAVNQVLGGTATFSDVTQGVTGGPFSDATVDSFNGSSSYLTLPSDLLDQVGNESVSLWFKTTTTGGVLLASSGDPITDGTTSGNYTPDLYVGSDGYLQGEVFWDGGHTDESAVEVDDGKWHNVVLASSGSEVVLYLDGAEAGSLSDALTTMSQPNVYVGAGFIGGGWPDETHASSSSNTGYATYFDGDISEVAYYPSDLSAAQVSAQWRASKYSSGLTPVQTDLVTDPGGNTLTWKYDLLNGGRVLSQTDARGGKTTYGYDVDGFQDEVVNPDGDVTQTGYDVRGNMVSQTTCQDQAAEKCSTGYYTYYPDDTSMTLTPDPRNDVLLTYRDPRSASSTDTTYETTYTYNSLGELTEQTTPPVAGFSSGRTTSYRYTDGTTTAGGYDGAIPPAGLEYQETTPGDAVTTTLYYADGDVAETIDPDGQKTVYEYDGIGRKTSQTVYSDSYPDGLATTYIYNKNGQVVTETDPSVTNRVTGAVHTAQTTTTYDPDGNVLTQAVADTTGGDASRTVTDTYNPYDQLASQTDANGATTSYTYNSYGDVATETDPDGNVTSYTYDGDGNLLTTTLENYTGSPAGSQAASNLVEESRSYDPAGRLASVTDAMGRVTEYGYTDNGLLASVTDVSADGTQTFTEESDSYDPAGNLVQKVTGNGETTTDYTVDAASRVTQEVLDPAGLDRTTSISYTPDDQQASVTQSGSSGTAQTTSYTYDPMGNMTSESVTQAGAGGPVASFPLTQASGTSVPDSASGGQPATASGVTWTGSGASFSGTSGQQVATGGPVVDTTGSFTVAAWVDLAVAGSSSETAVAQRAGSASAFYLKYDQDSGGWQFARNRADGSGWAIASSGAAATGTWTFLTGTYDVNTGTMVLYVNGAQTGTATDSAPNASAGPLLIGRSEYSGAPADFFDGQIADVQVYPRALSATEVSALYGLGRGGGDITTGKLTTSWTLDQRGLPTSMTDPDGNVTDYSYDEAGQLAVTTEPPVTTETYGGSPVTARPVTTTGYDTFGDATQTEDPNGNVTTYGYDAEGQQTSQTLPSYTPPGSSSPVAATDTMAYDGLGQLTSQTDPLGSTTKYAYDQLGDLTSETAPDGSVTSYTYDADGEQLSQTSPTGAQTQATYDFLGRQVTATQIERYSGSGTAAYTTNYSYGTGGWLAQTQTPDGVSTRRGYDPAGELISVTDGAGNETSYKYDDLGRQTAVVYPDGTSTVTGYDALGDVTSTSDLDPSGNTLSTSSATYDGEGDELSSTNADGNTSTFTYDATGMLTGEVQPVTSSSSIVTSFGYDAAGNQTRYTDGDGNDWYYTYNSWNLPESRIEPSTSQYTSGADSTFTTAYDADGQPVSETEPGGATISDTYNNVGELTSQAGTGADAATATRTFGYDAVGDMTSAATSDTAPSGSASNATSESFTYNDRGQVLTASGSAGSTSYAYNGDGLVTAVADAAGTTSYTYDSADRLSSLTDPATGTTATYAYNNDSLVSEVNYGSDVEHLTYDYQHQLSTDTLQTSAGSTVASVSYGYDPAGQLTSMDTTGLAGASSNSYTYDEAGRLTSWNNGATTTGYGYDADGNLTQDGPETYTYDARDELTSDGTRTYAYTARGTLASATSSSGTVTSSYDAYGDQVSEGTQSYSYDAQGRMVSDLDSSTQAGYDFSYVGATGAVASDGASTYTWDPSGTSLAGIGVPGGDASQGVLAFTDAHGDVVGQFTASGTALSGSTGYDPWGDVTGTSGSVQGLLGFQSGWTDPATGKVAMGARWYDPQAGGFASADTVQVSPVPDPAMGNPFAYAGDSPLDGTDPTGHMTCIMTGVGGCAVVSVLTVPSAAGQGGGTLQPGAVAQHMESGQISKPAAQEQMRTASSFSYYYWQWKAQAARAQAERARKVQRAALQPVLNVPHQVADSSGEGQRANVTHIVQSAKRAQHSAGRKAATRKPSAGPGHPDKPVPPPWSPRPAPQPRGPALTPVPDPGAAAAIAAAAAAAAAAAMAADNPGGPNGNAIRKAAAAAAPFLQQYGPQILGTLVTTGCDLLTGGEGARTACPAAGGAVEGGLSYLTSCAGSGCSAAQFLLHTATGAAAWAAGGIFGPDSALTDTASLTPAAEEVPSRGVTFFDESTADYYKAAGATLGRPGGTTFFMSEDDSALVNSSSDAARYSGMAPSVQRAYVSGEPVYGVNFPTAGLEVRVPTAADAGGFEHFLEGGQTAVRLANDGGYLVNPVSEFVTPGGLPVPEGSFLFRLGPGGEQIPIRGF